MKINETKNLKMKPKQIGLEVYFAFESIALKRKKKKTTKTNKEKTQINKSSHQ